MKYLPDAERTMGMTTEELREHFLVQNLFREGEVTLTSASIRQIERTRTVGW
jgi:5-keto 4-deoxyuronate isomerase